LIGAFKVFLPLWRKDGSQVNTFYEETGVFNYDGEFAPKFYEPIQANFGHLAPTLMTFFISVGQTRLYKQDRSFQENRVSPDSIRSEDCEQAHGDSHHKAATTQDVAILIVTHWRT